MKNERRNGFGLSTVLIIVAGLFVLGGAGYYVTQNYRHTVSPPYESARSVRSDTTHDSRTVAPDEHASDRKPPLPATSSSTIDASLWKTYQNNKEGVIFQYPLSWKLTAEEGRRGFPWLQIRMGPEWPDRVLTFGCSEGVPLSSGPSGYQISGLGNDTTINFNGELVKVIGKKPQEYSEGESFGYDLTRCSQKSICINVFRYSRPISQDDRLFIESIKLLRPLESYDKSECNLSKG